MGRRAAFTLTELLLVVAIIGVVVGLLAPAVQKVRELASRSGCANHLRQIALAAQQYTDTHQAFPTGMSYQDGNGPYLFLSWLAPLLPYVEQENLWTATTSAYEQVPNPFPKNNPPHIGFATVVHTFACPADPRATEVQMAPDLQVPVALTSYLGVEGKDLYSLDGIFFVDSEVRIPDITDGTSCTLLAGERPPSANFQFGWWYAGAGQQLTGSGDMVLGVEEQNVLPYSMAPCFAGVYKYGPGTVTNQCDMFHFWSLHHGGANFAFADGSVHFLGYSAASILPALASRAGGEAIEAP